MYDFHFTQYWANFYNPDSVRILISVLQWYVCYGLKRVEREVENQEDKLCRDFFRVD
jgi:hypothetical protein